MTAARKLDLDPIPALEDDLVWRAFLNAPMGPPLTEVERAAVEAAERSIVAGVPGRSQEEVEALIERMRSEQDDGLED
jgi:hypothetical protein